MNFLTFFALASNFLVFWGLSLSAFFLLIAEEASGGSYVVLLLGMVVIASVISLLTFIVPMLVTTLLGLSAMALGEGVWILEFLGTALLLGSLGLLFLYGQVNLDSLKARYWRHMWTHKSPLEEKLGASSPYVSTEMDDELFTFFFVVIWPFILFQSRNEPTPISEPTPPEKPIPWFDPNKIGSRLTLIADHLVREHNSQGSTLKRMTETAERLGSSKREKLDRVVALLDRMEASPSGLTKKDGYELSQLVIQLWKGIVTPEVKQHGSTGGPFASEVRIN